MKRREQALLFLRKAAQDESLLDAVLESDSVSDEKFQYWQETPGNVYYEAATGGQVLYQAA